MLLSDDFFLYRDICFAVFINSCHSFCLFHIFRHELIEFVRVGVLYLSRADSDATLEVLVGLLGVMSA